MFVLLVYIYLDTLYYTSSMKKMQDISEWFTQEGMMMIYYRLASYQKSDSKGHKKAITAPIFEMPKEFFE